MATAAEIERQGASFPSSLRFDPLWPHALAWKSNEGVAFASL